MSEIDFGVILGRRCMGIRRSVALRVFGTCTRPIDDHVLALFGCCGPHPWDWPQEMDIFFIIEHRSARGHGPKAHFEVVLIPIRGEAEGFSE